MTRLRLCLRAACLALIVVAYLGVAADAQTNSAPVVVGQINGIVNTATLTYVDRVVTDAERSNAPAVVFTVDTPGGLPNAVRDIDLRIDRSTVPVLVDRGGDVYDARVVGIDPSTAAPGPATSLARGARDVADVLRQVDGATVQAATGPVTLRTANTPARSADMSATESFVHAITTPTIAYVLLSFGTLGLLLELFNPGSVLPGVFGGICLFLAFFGFATLPLNSAGVALVAVGMLLFALEPFLTAHGTLALGGALAFVFGSAMLVDAPDAPYLQIPPLAIASVTAVLCGFFVVLVGFIVRARHRTAVTGHESLVGASGVVRRDIHARRQGMVFVQGELWRATTAAGHLSEGEQVIVERVEGLVLTVRRASRLVPAPRPAAPAEAKSKGAGV